MTRIVCLGDSITVGQYLPPELAWPNLLTRYEVIPAGVNSDTTRLALERFPRDVQERRPDGVVIQFGHNDCNRWASDRNLRRVSIDAYEANLYEMEFRASSFSVVPLFCTLTPSSRIDRHTEDVELYNDVLVSVARATTSRVIDVRAAFMGMGGLLLDDGLHLSAEGHRVYAVIVQAALDEVFG